MSGNADSAGKGFRMNQIPSIFGREISYGTNHEAKHVISFVIFPCEDLFIKYNIELEITFPVNFQTTAGEVILKAKQPEVFRGCPFISVSSNYIRFPWLEDATKYPISVWFYTVRQLLKRAKRSAWKTPVLIKSSFVESREKLSSAGLVTLIEAPIPPEGAGRTKGRRSYMEDVDFIFDCVRVTDKRSVGVFGVLDGHGGKECAEEIPAKIAASLRSGKSCPEALFKSFIDTDAEFLDSSSGNLSGSTANVMLWDKTTGFAYVANTADTRAVLCRCGVALDLSIDRKASDPEEISRIAESGGFVANGRVQGSLAVSRALGDAKLKITVAAEGGTVLIPDPEVTTFRPCSAMDDFVIIATDGLWDVMSSQAAVDYVTENLIRAGILTSRAEQSEEHSVLEKREPSRELIIERLCSVANSLADHAIDPMRSLDNVTVMIVLITDPAKPWGARGDGRVLDSYWQVSDNTECAGEDTGLNGLGQPHGDRDRDLSGQSSTSRKKYIDSHEDKYSAAGSSLHYRAESSSQGARQDDAKAVDSLLISRLNCDSKGTSSASAYTSRNSSSSSSQSSQAARGEDKSGQGQGSTQSNISEVKSNSSNSGSGGSSSTNSLKGHGKKKEKDEDDIMDYLLDDSNF